MVHVGFALLGMLAAGGNYLCLARGAGALGRGKAQHALLWMLLGFALPAATMFGLAFASPRELLWFGLAAGLGLVLTALLKFGVARGTK